MPNERHKIAATDGRWLLPEATLELGGAGFTRNESEVFISFGKKYLRSCILQKKKPCAMLGAPPLAALRTLAFGPLIAIYDKNNCRGTSAELHTVSDVYLISVMVSRIHTRRDRLTAR